MTDPEQPTQRTNLRDRLRRETRPAHDALDQALDLIDRPIDLPGYTRLLARFHGFHRAIEPALAATLPAALTEGRSKLSALRHDLLTCGMREHEIAALSAIAGLPALTGRPEAMGALYVVEGSTLGGRLIGRHMQRNPAIPADACHYFNVYGEGTGERWREICDALERVSDPDTDDRAMGAANAIFARLQDWLMPGTDGGRDRD
ncbi:biliverdin-producing heme oxygenase [Lichenicola sp.]|uniref:biliverdin-producing heme oxygenase n=1 Tax=Lichenicola sp. TaxID=2804529 RepID=UPI003AFFAD7A